MFTDQLLVISDLLSELLSSRHILTWVALAAT